MATIISSAPRGALVAPTEVDSARRDATLDVLVRATTLPQVYQFAARLIVKNGHHQGDYMPDPFDRRLTSLHIDRPLSIVAAIRAVANGNPHVMSPFSELAVRVLAHRLTVNGEGPFSETRPELAEHGIAGTADVLPVPVGPEPKALGLAYEEEIRSLDLLSMMSDRVAPVISGHLAALLAEIERLRTRVAELEPVVDGLRRELGEHLEFERRLQRRIDELAVERHVTNEALDDAICALRERQVEREALVERLRAGQQWERGRDPELVSENYVSQSELREIFGIPLTAPWDEPAAVPRTERARMVAIAEALNAAEAAGLALGIDLDGTITDHNAWSVVWLTTEKRWTVAGWEDGEPAETGGAS
jgi:hypothetical protein